MELEDKIRIDALKKAALVMKALADSMKDYSTKEETKSLAWSISWAVSELTKLKDTKHGRID